MDTRERTLPSPARRARAGRSRVMVPSTSSASGPTQSNVRLTRGGRGTDLLQKKTANPQAVRVARLEATEGCATAPTRPPMPKNRMEPRRCPFQMAPGTPPLERLPPDLLRVVAGHLPPPDLGRLCQAARRLRHLRPPWLSLAGWCRVRALADKHRSFTDAAVDAGDVRLLDWARPASVRQARRSGTAMQIALDNGNLRAIDWLLAAGARHPSGGQVGRCTHLHVVEHLLRRLPELADDSDLGVGAAAAGHMHVFEWLFVMCLNEDPSPLRWDFPRCFEQAAHHGRMAILDFMSAEVMPEVDDGTACMRAAGSGHLTMLTFLHKRRGFTCDQRAFRMAAENGHLPVLEWLFANTGCC